MFYSSRFTASFEFPDFYRYKVCDDPPLAQNRRNRDARVRAETQIRRLCAGLLCTAELRPDAFAE
jgi:hypothetical protein